jgi:FkbM family methyltransferase
MVDRFWLGLFHLRIAFATGLRLRTPSPVNVRLAPDGQQVVISDPGELTVLHDVLFHREYEHVGKPEVVFDLGANVGFATLFFKRENPTARIVAVEADPRTYERLIRNVGRLPGVTTLNRAVSASDGLVSFFSSPSSLRSALVRRSEGDQEVKVIGSTLQTLMDQTGVEHIGLLKVDIEGAEFNLFRNAPLERVDEIIAEIHYDLMEADEDALRELLADFELRFEELPQPHRCLLFARRVSAGSTHSSCGSGSN